MKPPFRICRIGQRKKALKNTSVKAKTRRAKFCDMQPRRCTRRRTETSAKASLGAWFKVLARVRGSLDTANALPSVSWPPVPEYARWVRQPARADHGVAHHGQTRTVP